MKEALIALGAILVAAWLGAALAYQPPQIEDVPATATPSTPITVSVPSTYTPTSTPTQTASFTQTPTRTPTQTPTNTFPTYTPAGFVVEVISVKQGEIQVQIGEDPQ